MRVLVVDDNADAADTLAVILSTEGYSTTAVHDPRGGLAAAERELPQIALLDICMPEMTGYVLAKSLRSICGLEDIPLVAITGWGASSDKERAREAGFDRHLTKPADIDEILKILSAVREALQSGVRARDVLRWTSAGSPTDSPGLAQTAARN